MPRQSPHHRPGVRDDRAAVAVAGLLSFAAMLDMNVVNLALPAVTASFASDPRAAQWVLLGYAIPAVAFLLPAGRWLDGVSVRPAAMAAVAGFGLANVLAVLAPTLGVLIGLRFLQGTAGAVVMVLMPVLAVAGVAPERRGRAMAVPATAGPIGGVVGPALGGPLIDWFGWRSVFVPVVLVCLLAGFLLARRTRLPRGSLTAPDRAAVTDAGLLVVGLGALLAVVTGAHLPVPITVAAIAIATGLLAGWLRRAGTRAIGAVLRESRTLGTVLAVALLAAAFTAVSYLVAVRLVRIGGVSATTAGLVLLAFPLTMGIGGPVAGRLADKAGPRAVAVAGAALAAAGFGLLALLSAGGEPWEPVDVAWRLAVAGFGTALYGGPTQLLVVTAVPAGRVATAAAGVQFARSLGFALGPAAAALAWSADATVLHAGPALIVVTAAAVVAVGLLVPRAGRHAAVPAHGEAVPDRPGPDRSVPGTPIPGSSRSGPGVPDTAGDDTTIRYKEDR